MDRRRFLVTCLVGAVAAPSVTEAQRPKDLRHIGWLDHFDAAMNWEAPLVRELRELGYNEAREFVLDVQHADWQFNRLPTLAAALVQRKIDLIVAYRDPAIDAAMRATRTTPIVMVGSSDPVGLGFVSSLGRPGKNITGLSDNSAELAGKQLEFLAQAIPRLARASIITAAGRKEQAQRLTRQAARALGVAMEFDEVQNRTDVERMFGRMASKPDALMVIGAELLDAPSIIRIGQLARMQKIPMISDAVFLSHHGGLMSYGASYAPLAKRAAWYAVKILKGTKPGDLPVEQPTTFELVVNLDTAKALGLMIPPSLRLRADHVIE